MQRRHFTQTASIDVRLANEATKLRKEAKGTPHGIKRERLMRRARQPETGSHLSEWLSSPGRRSKVASQLAKETRCQIAWNTKLLCKKTVDLTLMHLVPYSRHRMTMRCRKPKTGLIRSVLPTRTLGCL